MLPPIQFHQLTSYISVHSTSFLNSLSSEQAKRIRDIALSIFSRIATFFKSFNTPSKQSGGNIKAFAMISCVLLVALLIISMLRQRDTQLIPPPTPDH